MGDDTKSKIAELEKELYTKDFKPYEGEDMFTRKEAMVPTSWSKEQEAVALAEEQARSVRQHYMIKKIVLISAGFFSVAVVIAGVIWLRGSNITSSANIVVDISAPVAVAAGEPFETKFSIANNNKVSLERAVLFVEYPAGFYSITNKDPLPRITKNLGTIAPGQTIVESLSTILYGEENSQKEVAVILEYRMAGSNATLKKPTTYSIRISSSPINLKFGIPKEISSGQEVEFMVEIGSNSKIPQDGLLFEAAYPIGFVFKNAEPAASFGNTTWVLGTLAAQEKRTIKIRGVIEGQENEEKSMKFSIGAQNPKDERQIGVIYNTIEETIIVAKPFLGLDIAINGDRSLEYSAALGRSIRTDITWQSNDSVRVTDAVIEITLKGEALNRYSIHADNGGFYQSSNNTIVWNKAVHPALASIEPGERGSVSFGFSPIALGIDAGRAMRNPKITLEIKARARNTSTATPEEVVTLATRTVKFDTDLRLATQSLYYAGPFKNSGPIPPKADTLTTYTIKWAARNGSNNASGVAIKTTLPVYVKWLGQISPSGEDITYNENNAEVVWNVGRIPAGGTREAAFQISFLPSLSQLNMVPYLTGDSIVSGVDEFTKTVLSDRKAPVTTNLSSDPKFSQNQAAVVQ